MSPQQGNACAICHFKNYRLFTENRKTQYSFNDKSSGINGRLWHE